MVKVMNKRLVQFGLLTVLSVLLLGCGNDGKLDENVVTRVAIDQGSVLLTGINETKTLSAKAFNAAGEEMDTEITWSSSNTQAITIFPGLISKLQSPVKYLQGLHNIALHVHLRY